jgi:hypothetical protein
VNRVEEQVFGQWQCNARHGEKSKGGGSKAGQGPEGEGRDQDRGWDQFTVAAKPDSLVFQNGPSGFFSLRTGEAFEDYRTRDGSDTSLVSSRPYA